MNNDYIKPEGRLLFCSRHEKTDPFFKLILWLMAIVAIAQIIKAI